MSVQLKVFALCTFFATVLTINAQNIYSFKSGNILPGTKVSSIVIDTSGNKWFGTDNGITSFNGTNWHVFTTDSGLASNNIYDLAFEMSSYGPEIWAATDSGVTVFSITSVDAITCATPYRTDNTYLISDNVYCVSVDTAKHERWFGTASGISIFDGSNWYDTTYSLLIDHKITSFGISYADDWRYITLDGGGVSRAKFNNIDGFTGASAYIMPWSGSLLTDSVFSSYIQEDGHQWFGTAEGVSYHSDSAAKQGWTAYPASGDLVSSPVLSVITDYSGNMWFGTKSGVSFLDLADTTWSNYTEADGLIGNTVYDIAIDKDSSIWFATNAGVSHMKNENWETFYFSAINKPAINDTYIDIYPNPFYLPGQLTIKLNSIDKPIIGIYSIYGENISIIVPGNTNIAYWNGKNSNGESVMPGIYILRITSKQQAISRKILVVY